MHVECSSSTNPSNIRFTNLQSGSGTVLVIDANGYVFKSAAGVTAAAPHGKLLTSLVLAPSAGKSQVQLNTGGLASGIYMYSLIVNGKVLDTKKLVVSK